MINNTCIYFPGYVQLPTNPTRIHPTTPSPFRGPPHGHGVRDLRSCGGGTRPPAQQLAAQGAFSTAPVAIQVIATPSGDPLVGKKSGRNGGGEKKGILT